MPEIESSSECAIMEEDTHTDSHAHSLLSLHSSFAICIAIWHWGKICEKEKARNEHGALCHNLTPPCGMHPFFSLIELC